MRSGAGGFEMIDVNRILFILGMTLVIVAMTFALGFAAGWKWQASRVAEVKLSQQKDDTAAVTEAADQLKAAQDRADEIDRAAAARELVLTAKLQEAQDALKKKTLGRPCLGGPALRLLGTSPGLRLAPLLSDASGSLYGGSGAVAADPQDEGEYASDSQIADWIAVAGAQYERCRSRIGDIRAWRPKE